jgi:hypothetical protein
MSTKAALDNIIAFTLGDLAATLSLLLVSNKWLLTAETVALKLMIIILSGLVGGAAGLLGKHLMQKVIDKYFQLIIGCCLLATLASGCKTQTAGVQHYAALKTKDSTSVQIVERFVPVQLPGDTVWYEHWIECPEYPIYDNYPTNFPVYEKPKPKPFKAQVKGNRSNAVIELNDAGRLMAVFNCNAWKDSVKVRDTEIARLQSVAKSDSTVVTVHVRYIPKAYKASMWFSWIIIGLLVLWIGWKVAKIYFKIQIPFLK